MILPVAEEMGIDVLDEEAMDKAQKEGKL